MNDQPDDNRPPANVPVNLPGGAPDYKKTRRARAALTDPTKVDRLPPHSIEAEQGVLGCILLEPLECVDAVKLAGLTADWFYDLRHRTLYEFAAGLVNESVLDMVTLIATLNAAACTEGVGGIAYVASLPDTVPSAANLGHYLAIVREMYLLRQSVAACTEVVARAYEPNANAEDIVGELLATAEALSGDAVMTQAVPVKEFMPAVIDMLEEDVENYHRGSAQLHGLTTGFDYADKLWGGIGGRNGNYGIIAARPGDGKTMVAMQIAEHVAKDHKWFTPRQDAAGNVPLNERGKPLEWDEHRGLPVCVFSLEMSRIELVTRMLFRRAGVDSHRFKTGFASKGDFDKLAAATAQLNLPNLFIDDEDNLTIDDLRARARLMARQHGIKLFIVDYVQLLRPARRYGRPDKVQEMSDISNGIRQMAKRLNVPFIVLAQMNRDFAKEKGVRKPRLEDLRDSGSLEQDAHWVTFLYEPEMSESRKDDFDAQLREVYGESVFGDWVGKPRKMELLFAKNRHGLKDKGASLLFNAAGHGFEDFVAWQKKNQFKEPAKGERKVREGEDVL